MIVFALRHADRTGEELDLNQKGKGRAELLARILGESGVSIAFHSSEKRTRQTLEPLKALLGNRLTIMPPVDIHSPTHVKDIVDGVKKALSQNAVVVVVGHSDTVPKVVGELTGTELDDINAKEFDRLYVVPVCAGGGSTFALTRYGEKTPP